MIDKEKFCALFCALFGKTLHFSAWKSVPVQTGPGGCVRDREALFVEELSEGEIEAIRRTVPSADAAQYDHELTAASGQR